jgi:hypothetical protein
MQVGGLTLQVRVQVRLQPRLATNRVEAEQSRQTLAHCRVGLGALQTGPEVECVCRLRLQIMRGFRQAGVPDLPGTLMHNMLHGMP